MNITHSDSSLQLLKAAQRQNWDPKIWPFRVTFWASTGGYSGRYVSRAYTFATLAEAEEFIPLAAKHQPSGATACIDRAEEGPGGWQKSGRWIKVPHKS